MIRTRLIGQLGNQLFTYVIGKILAVKTGMRYDPPTEFLDKTGGHVKWSADPIWRMLPTDGRECAGKPHVISTGQWYDLDSLSNEVPLYIEYGYFQNYGLIRNWKAQIREEWLKIPTHRFVETRDDTVYMHVRRTDYCRPISECLHCGIASTIQEFRDCMNEFPECSRVVVCTDGPDDAFFDDFNQVCTDWSFSGGKWDEDFLLLASAKHLVLSQSTFSWWAGFLGRAEKIVCSVPPGTFWHRGLSSRQWPRLYVDDEPDRWRWINKEKKP